MNKWVWMPHAAHFICAKDCQFHLATYVGGGFLVSTVGELWPERAVREIHASVHDADWFAKNRQLKGDAFDDAYMKRFGFQEIGLARKYETLVFKAKRAPEKRSCCPWRVGDLSEIDGQSYNEPDEAYRGHLDLCKKWSAK